MRFFTRWILLILALLFSLLCHRWGHAGTQDGPDGVDPLGIFAANPFTYTPKYFVTQDVTFEHVEVPRADEIPWCAGPGGQTSQQLDAVCRDLCKTHNTSSKGCVLFDAEGKYDIDGQLSCKCTWICMPVLKFYQ